MLVLSRKPQQKIIIGDSLITVQILNIDNGSVRLGFEAPRDISIHRQEIYARLQQALLEQHCEEGVE